MERNVLTFSLCLVLASSIILTYRVEPIKAEPTTIVVPDDFERIQWALGNASDGDTIYVRAGIYSENLQLDFGNVCIEGESNANTTIDGTITDYGATNLTIRNFHVSGNTIFGHYASYETIENNIFDSEVRLIGIYHTFRNNILFGGLDLEMGYHEPAYYIDILNNTLLNQGIHLLGSCYINVSGNTIIGAPIGILEEHGHFDSAGSPSNYNSYFRNNISFCDIGLRFKNSIFEPFYDPHSYCVISENIFHHNTFGIYAYWIDELNVYSNDFINNTNQVDLNYTGFNPPFNLSNSFDAGFPSGGNYWTDYDGIDVLSGPYQNETRKDGIGDTPYLVDQNDTDSYPLMSPFTNHTIYVPTRYDAIQKAINSAKTGDTVFIFSGTYEERDPITGERAYFYINKSVSLIGESPLTTVVCPGETYVLADHVKIQSLTFYGTFYHAYGLVVLDVYNTTISHCRISSETALYISGGGNHSISNCRIYGDRHYGLYLHNSAYDLIHGNHIDGAYDGAVGLSSSSLSLFSSNTLSAAGGPCVWISNSNNNTFYHNNFFWGCEPAPPISVGSGLNYWNSGYPLGGNYWSSYYTSSDDYNGIFQNETGSDGIGDVPCLIAPNNRDNYPLMEAASEWEFDVSVKGAFLSKTVVSSGYLTSISVLVKNEGFYASSITGRVTLNATHIYEPLAYDIVLMGNAANGWNYSTPGPTLRANRGDTLRLTLTGADNVHHKFYVDYNGNEFPDTEEPQTSPFINTTISYEFEAQQVGNFTYYCAYNQGTMFGSLIISEQPPPIPVIIGSQNVTLSILETKSVIFIWNTTGFLKGNYTLTASIEPITGEWNTANNILLASKELCITIAGDVDADHDVDIFDIVLMAGAYGTSTGDAEYIANCDIDSDGDIDIFDLVRAAGNYGKRW